jgi:hypothetical protein
MLGTIPKVYSENDLELWKPFHEITPAFAFLSYARTARDSGRAWILLGSRKKTVDVADQETSTVSNIYLFRALSIS